MAGKSEERIIQDQNGKTVAVMQLKNGVLDGKCEWFNGKGELVVYGFFKEGKPWAGTFLNWTLFMQGQNIKNPYDVAIHCRDWISLFEASFDSEIPHYEKLIEVYSIGKRLKR
jgi:hypothetical protein